MRGKECECLKMRSGIDMILSPEGSTVAGSEVGWEVTPSDDCLNIISRRSLYAGSRWVNVGGG